METKMKELNQGDLSKVSGGEIIPGWPSPEIMCTNTKLLVLGSLNQPGFDVGAATMALMNTCPVDFWDPNMAHDYATSGGGMMPPP
jgi:hypothetical protein